ncbi:hypothetical protein ACU11_10960 [Xanthomonas oryzae pv. oryzicola]|nr:hypothetical protein ACU11_10960 [Xanthomonas oryzae pv. oryzicola]
MKALDQLLIWLSDRACCVCSRVFVGSRSIGVDVGNAWDRLDIGEMRPQGIHAMLRLCQWRKVLTVKEGLTNPSNL